MKELLIVTLIAVLLASGIALAFEGNPMSRTSNFYFFKYIGEKIKVHFLTFSAQAKQQKHLEYAERRLSEWQDLQSSNSREGVGALSAYKGELSIAYSMAEQLALVDPNLRYLLADVYDQTISQLSVLYAQGDPTVLDCGLIYNSAAMKTLLHKYQLTAEDHELYQQMLENYYILQIERELFGDDQVQLQKARDVLDEGVELEWAYDLLSSIR